MMDTRRVTQNKGFYFTVEFWMILLVSFLPTLISLTRNLWTMHTLGTSGDAYLAYYQMISTGTIRWLIVDLLPSVIGVLTVSVLALVGIIDIGRIKWNHVLTTFLLVFLCDEQFGYKLVDLSEAISVDAAVAASLFGTCYQFFSLVTMWRWFVLCIYLISVSGRFRKVKVILAVVVSILIIWSALMTIFDDMIFKTLKVHEALIWFANDISSWFYRTTWINRTVVLCVALVSGKTTWRWGTTILCVLVKAVLTVLLVPVILFQINMSPGGLALAEFVPYLVIGAICFLNFKTGVRRTGKNRQF